MIPLVVIDTEPSDSIVQVFEETTIEFSDEVEVSQNSEVTTSLPFNYKKSSTALSHSIAVTTEPTESTSHNENNKRIRDSVYMQSYNQTQKLTKKEKNTEISITVSDKIVIKIEEHYDLIVKNITELNNKYDVKDNITLFISVEYPASLLRGWKTSPVTVC